MASARTWLTAVRAYSYPASVVPIALGSALAYREIGRLHLDAFVLALLAGILVHTGCNLLNDLYDFRRGVDREDTFGGSGVLVSGALSEEAIARGAWL
ncbi:MAG: prenyltransferase, partial [Candidatus Binatia bacterium]